MNNNALNKINPTKQVNLKEFWCQYVPERDRYIVETMTDEHRGIHLKRFERNVMSQIDFSTINNILDWGCGGGLLTKELAAQAKVFALDICPSSLKHCSQYTNNAVTPVEFPSGVHEFDPSVLPHIDLIHSMAVIHSFPSMDYWKKIVALWKSMSPEYIAIQTKLGDDFEIGPKFGEGNNYINSLILSKETTVSSFKDKYSLTYFNEEKAPFSDAQLGFYIFKKNDSSHHKPSFIIDLPQYTSQKNQEESKEPSQALPTFPNSIITNSDQDSKTNLTQEHATQPLPHSPQSIIQPTAHDQGVISIDQTTSQQATPQEQVEKCPLPFVTPDLQLSKTVAIVCNSGHLVGLDLGAEIDSHDEVIRSNRAPTEGYESDVGSKTTLRIVTDHVFTNLPLKEWKVDQYFVRRLCNSRLLVVCDPVNHPYQNYIVQRDLHTDPSNEIFVLNAPSFYPQFHSIINAVKRPTLGMSAILNCVMAGIVPDIYGFDLKERPRDHYWEVRDTQNSYVNHNPDIEKLLISQWHQEGKVRVLSV